MKIIFSGTPEFSIPSLEYIYKNYNLIAIITKPDKPAGRGLKMRYPAVKEWAIQHKIKCFQPFKLNEAVFIQNIKKLKPDMIIDVSYGKLFPDELIQLPEKACINVHPSLLPGYKGPCPMRWVIVHGEKFTGVSAHLITNKIDSGTIIYQEKLNIDFKDEYKTLYKKLSDLAACVLRKSIKNFLKNDFLLKVKDNYKIKNFYAKKITKENFYINWDKNSLEIYNLIRGLKGKPTAHTTYKNKIIKIYKSEIADLPINTDSFLPGEIVTADKIAGINIKTKDGFLKILELQNENKKVLQFKDFLNGTKLTVKEKFYRC